MGTQNGSKNEIRYEKILIHSLELKLRPFKVYPYVCIGSHVFAMFGVPMCVIKKIARAAHA